MKAIMIMYDSLNRHMLAPYGCEWTKTPNFERLAERCVTFDKCYVGSLPCICLLYTSWEKELWNIVYGQAVILLISSSAISPWIFSST